MATEKYNGWTNYATWRVNLEMFDGVAFLENHTNDTYEYSQRLREYAEELLNESTAQGFALDYALAFISDVNWYEIAESMQAEYNDNNEESEAA